MALPLLWQQVKGNLSDHKLIAQRGKDIKQSPAENLLELDSLQQLQHSPVSEPSTALSRVVCEGCVSVSCFLSPVFRPSSFSSTPQKHL